MDRPRPSFEAEFNRLTSPEAPSDINRKFITRARRIRNAQIVEVRETKITLAEGGDRLTVIVAPQSTATARLIYAWERRELLVAAVLGALRVPALSGITDVWELPVVFPPKKMVAPLGLAAHNDITQLMLPARAHAVRSRIIRDYGQSKKKHMGDADIARSIVAQMTAGAVDEAYRRYLAHRGFKIIQYVTVQPRIVGYRLTEVLQTQTWRPIRDTLFSTIRALGRLQQAHRFMHCNLTPDSIIMSDSGDILFVNLGRAWLDTPAGFARLDNPVGAYAPGLDVRMLAAFLARLRESLAFPPELDLVVAALLAPTRAMVDAARLGDVTHVRRRYVYNEPYSTTFREYVTLSMRIAASLFGGGTDADNAVAWSRPLMHDVAPWACAYGDSRWGRIALEDPDDLCLPANALRLDIWDE